MASPQPWSFSALEQFKNCPKQFQQVRVAKRFKETQSEQMLWGNRVHKAFELRQSVGQKLPPEMSEHESYMAKIEDYPGFLYTEQKVGLNLKGQPCDFFASDVWMRAIIDWKKIDMTAEKPIARIIDYKTGKVHEKFDQLALCAIHTFAAHPEIQICDVRFYWTNVGSATRKVYGRAEIPELWKLFIPDLKQYSLAFKTDTWQPRQSGLCNGWCPVTDCEFWRPKRSK